MPSPYDLIVLGTGSGASTAAHTIRGVLKNEIRERLDRLTSEGGEGSGIDAASGVSTGEA